MSEARRLEGSGLRVHAKIPRVMPPVCDYCGSTAILVDSSVIYNGRSYGRAWVCGNYPECDAYVGCHPGTDKPLGRLANPALRAAKQRAHAALDPLWREAPRMYADLPEDDPARKRAIKKIRRRARSRVYAWLGEQMGLEAVHVGEFTEEQCEQAIALCEKASPEVIRAWSKARGKETA